MDFIVTLTVLSAVASVMFALLAHALDKKIRQQRANEPEPVLPPVVQNITIHQTFNAPVETGATATAVQDGPPEPEPLAPLDLPSVELAEYQHDPLEMEFRELERRDRAR